MTIAQRLTLSLTILLLAIPALAAAADDIRFTSTAEIEVQEVNAKGEKVMVRKPAVLVVPGTLVIYTNSYVNAGLKPAERVVITNPIPRNMEYLGGSAAGKGTVVTFSVDDGKTFDAPDKLFIKEKDGKSRPADPKEYSHIRWIVSQPVPPGGKGAVEYRAKLK